MLEMLKTVMTNLVKKPSTRLYPKNIRDEFKGTRGKIDIDVDKCIFCGICAKKCPPDAIKVSKNTSEWEIDRFKCIICGSCVDACPKKCLMMDEKRQETAYKKSSFKAKKNIENKE